MLRADYWAWRACALLVGLAFVFAGCGGGSGDKATEEGEISTEVTYEKVPPGALPEVSAEMGGEGFTGEGWITNDDPGTGDPRAVAGGKFTFAIMNFPATLRTVGKDANSTFNSLLDGMVYESLIGTHPVTMQVTPSLATHWQISEDKLTYRFRINPNTRWADGSRLTAEDVIATWKLRLDPGILAPYSNILWGKYEEPVAESPYIVRVTSKELNWKFFIYFGGMNILPAKYIGNITGSEYMKAYQFKMMIGSGSYTLDPSKINKGRSIALDKRDDYWDKDNPKSAGLSNFDEIKFIVVKDERLNFEKFKKGETDAYVVSRAQWWVSETDFDHIKRGLIQKRKIWNDSPQGVQGFAFNMREAPFSDARMRMAFSLLVNREKLIENLFYNEYMIMDSYYPGSVYSNPDNPTYRYNPEEAIKLIADCGWKTRNEEGWLVNSNGEMLELNLMFGSKGFERILTVFQEDLRAVGIKLNLKQSTSPTMFKMVQERKFKIHWQAWGGLFFPNPENVWSSWTADPMNTNNLSGVKNERIDEICKAYNVEFDFNTRVEMIREVDRILMDVQPYSLGWYAPFSRILYWNKFGQPDFYLSRTGDWTSILSYWWIDPVKDAALEEAIKDDSIQLEVGKTKVDYWIEYNKTHGRSYEIKGM